ncbi:MAG: hypothetical protein AAGK32_03180, partial [Actinomycetota bacterium]
LDVDKGLLRITNQMNADDQLGPVKTKDSARIIRLDEATLGRLEHWRTRRSTAAKRAARWPDDDEVAPLGGPGLGGAEGVAAAEVDQDKRRALGQIEQLGEFHAGERSTPLLSLVVERRKYGQLGNVAANGAGSDLVLEHGREHCSYSAQLVRRCDRSVTFGQAAGAPLEELVAVGDGEIGESPAAEAGRDHPQPAVVTPSGRGGHLLACPHQPVGLCRFVNRAPAIANAALAVELVEHLAQDPPGFGLSPGSAKPSVARAVGLAGQLDHGGPSAVAGLEHGAFGG